MAAINRRSFLGTAASAGIGAAAMGAAPAEAGDLSRRLPREVWIATISMNGLTASNYKEMIDRLLERMGETVPMQPDIVCVPETGPFVNLDTPFPGVEAVAETPPGPISSRFAGFAKEHNCYVWCPIYTRENGRCYNSLVLFDRRGDVVGEYRKMHTTIGEMNAGVSPGPLDPPVFETDFGRVGAQICFDIEWLDGWRKLHQKGAEIVFWSSAFGGGRKVNMLANMFHYVVASSTIKGVTQIADFSGEALAWTGVWEKWCCAPVNLEKAFLHSWPYTAKFNDIRKKYGQAVRLTTFHDEEWSIIESVHPDVKVADIMAEFELKTYDQTVGDATKMQVERRG